MMISPIPPPVLLSNPKFAHLHEHLTTHLLHPDASTRSTNIQHNPPRDKLQNYHINAAKQQILTHHLRDLIADEKLDDALRELIHLLTSYLDHHQHVETVPPNELDLDLLRPELAHLRTRLPEIATAVGQCLTSHHESLLRIALAGSPSAQTKSAVLLADLLPSADRHNHATACSHQLLTDTTVKLLSLQTRHLAALIATLELQKYGLEARHLTSRAQHLDSIAEGIALKTRIMVLQDLRDTYDVRMQEALGRYQRHLARYAEHLGCREREVQRQVQVYENSDGDGGRVMDELGRRYSGLMKGIEGVKRDVARLRSAATGQQRGLGAIA